LAAVAMAAIALVSLRHELTAKAASRLEWALPPLLAVAVAGVLLFVSPGKRSELWTIAIMAGMAIGLGAGLLLKVDTDFERKLVRVHRTWDGVAVAALLLLLALARFVTSDLMGRTSGRYGVLGAIAAFLAAYLLGRIITVRYWTAPGRCTGCGVGDCWRSAPPAWRYRRPRRSSPDRPPP
ncbi:MAG: hypothetical protein NTZ05_08180, partial [Chloroflexi bacterium]|nr:hypothetical protein [Chloroflexota bacterium]